MGRIEQLRTRFDKAKVIAEEIIVAGDYRPPPTTTVGWVARIACTDVGQDAWQRAK